ncbi:multidrug efflux SMR transporter [Enterobacter ludwigii]|jgi:spermidine export protein MdtJ|nr:multidrug efflux SMR transporter [Enterobacter asburiae]
MNSLHLIKRDKAAWFFLVIAIIAEVIGTSFMASSARDGHYYGYVIMGIALAISYFFLALSTRSISVGVAYAIWEGMGVTLLMLVGIWVFSEYISIQEFVGLVIAIIGIVCVTLGEEH